MVYALRKKREREKEKRKEKGRRASSVAAAAAAVVIARCWSCLGESTGTYFDIEEDERKLKVGVRAYQKEGIQEEDQNRSLDASLMA